MPATLDNDIHQLRDALSDFPAAQSAAALTFLFETVLPLVEAECVMWMILVRLDDGELAEADPCHGWRVRELIAHHPSAGRAALVRRVLEHNDGPRLPLHLGMTLIALMRGSGRYRTARLHGGLVDLAAFRATEHYRLHYETAGIRDRMWVSCPVSADVESCFIFDNTDAHGQTRFTAASEARAERILRGMRWFHRRLALSRGIVAGQSPCTPAEHRVLRLLLSGQAEKGIADSLGQSTHTTHNHVRAVLKKFRVQSRVELMALWL